MKRIFDPCRFGLSSLKWNGSTLKIAEDGWQILASFSLLCLLTSCSGMVNIIEQKPLIGPTWVLESIQIYGQEPIDASNQPFTLRLKRSSFSILGPEEGRYLEGWADCNSYNGKFFYSEEDHSFSLIFLMHTDLYCGQNSLDRTFYSALSTANTYSITGDTLKLTWNHEDNALVFEAR